MNEEFISRLKSIKTSKEKKWMINMCVAMIKEHDKFKQSKNIHKANLVVNRYYKQHYENYFTKKMQDKPKKEREAYSKARVKNQKMTNKNKILGAKMRAIYKTYMEGGLSKKSEKLIDEKLLN